MNDNPIDSAFKAWCEDVDLPSRELGLNAFFGTYSAFSAGFVAGLETAKAIMAREGGAVMAKNLENRT